MDMDKDRITCLRKEQVVVSEITSGKTVRTVPVQANNPSVSPDGRWLVTDNWIPSESARRTELVDLQTGTSRRLSDGGLFNSGWASANKAALAVDDGRVLVLHPQTGELNETGVVTSVEPLRNHVHWSLDGRYLWVLGRVTKVSSLRTKTDYYLYTFDSVTGKRSQVKLPGEPGPAVWDDARKVLYLVTADRHLWQLAVK